MVVKIDGIGLTAEHFAGMNEKDAIAKMKADNILSTHKKDEVWAKGAYEQCLKATGGTIAKVKDKSVKNPLEIKKGLE